MPFSESTSETETAEASLRESQEHYRLVADAMPVLIAYCDREFTYRFCNAAYREWFGLTPDQVIDHSLREVVGEAAFKKIEPWCKRALQGERLTVEQSMPYKHGPPRHVLMEIIPHRSGGEVIGFYAMIQDISERKRAEEKLLELNRQLEKRVQERTRELKLREEELRVITDNTPAYIAYVDREQKYQFVNRTYEEKLGVPREKIAGRPVKEILGNCYPALRPRIEAALAGEEQVFEQQFTKDDSEDSRWMLVRYKPRREESGEVAGYFVLVTDITEERQLRMDVQKAVENEKRQLGRDLHDSLCQEVSGVSLLAKALQRRLDHKDADESTQAAAIVQRLNAINDALRQLARGLSPLALENLNLPEALIDMAEGVESLYPHTTCRVENRLQTLKLNENFATQLYVVAREAVFNAARHGEPSQILIILDRDGDDLTLTVKDNGTGKARQLAWEKGMGLRSMTYRMQTLGGSLEFRDNPAGEGLAVMCRIPLAL